MAANARHEKRPDPRAITAVTVFALAGAALLSYAIPASWESLSHLGRVAGVPYPWLLPAGIDGALIGLLAIDVALAAWGEPLGALHQVARGFALGSVVANAWAGWPDPAGVFLRVFAPVLIVVLCESARAVILRRARAAQRIPAVRWLLAPGATFRLWKRMKLWDLDSYQQVLDTELSRLRTGARLADRFGPGWESQIPGELALLLREGSRIAEALAMADRLCAPLPAPVPASPARAVPPRARSRRPGGKPGVAKVAEAQLIFATEPGVTAAEVARRVGMDSSYARKIRRGMASAPATGPIPAVSAEG